MPDRICFVIAPIGDPETEIRRRSDQVLKHIIRPVVEAKGYKAIRADEISEPGIITSQVIQHIINDPLVIADLTDRNPNVFYELAIRHAFRKPLVQIIQKDEPIPFDVSGMRTIPLDHRDLDSVEEAKLEIGRQVEAVEKPNAEIQSPISMAVDLQSFRQSNSPEQRSLGDIIAGMSDMRTAISSIQKQLENLRSPTWDRLLQERRNAIMHGPVPPALAPFLSHVELAELLKTQRISTEINEPEKAVSRPQKRPIKNK